MANDQGCLEDNNNLEYEKYIRERLGSLSARKEEFLREADLNIKPFLELLLEGLEIALRIMGETAKTQTEIQKLYHGFRQNFLEIDFDLARFADRIEEILTARCVEKSGESMEDAIIILGARNYFDGVGAEYGYLRRKTGICGEGWKLEKQSHIEKDNKHYDRIELSLPNGTKKTIYFDITSFFEKWSMTH